HRPPRPDPPQQQTRTAQLPTLRLNELRSRVMTWPKASDLVQQDEAQGERARRKLKRLGEEWRRRENSCQEFS
ncbi:hypothetical protein AB0J04_44425, partial [Streptomyces sp. NPDC050263]